MISLNEKLEQHNGIGPGFDFLRVVLSLGVVLLHSFTTTNEYFVPYNFEDTPVWMLHQSLVPMFFVVSGFLVAGSASRLSFRNYLISRALRIIPALATVTIISALIIGPIFTTVDMRTYFRSADFFEFFLNIIGIVHFTLPGVFMTHAVAEVNGTLWTVPFELLCYLTLPVMMAIGIMSKRLLLPASVFLYLIAATAIQHSHALDLVHIASLRKVISVAFVEHEAQAITCFLFGVTFFQNRKSIPYSPSLFLTATLVLGTIAVVFPARLGEDTIIRFIFAPSLTYFTIFIGLTSMPLPNFFKRGDYSYGVYLYHQPLLQMIVSLFPTMALAPGIGAPCTFLLGLPFVFLTSWLSWHLVERPLLTLRKAMSAAGRSGRTNDVSVRDNSIAAE